MTLGLECVGNLKPVTLENELPAHFVISSLNINKEDGYTALIKGTQLEHCPICAHSKSDRYARLSSELSGHIAVKDLRSQCPTQVPVPNLSDTI